MGEVAQFHGEDIRIGNFLGNGRRNRSRASTEINDLRTPDLRGAINGVLGDGLRLRPRDKDAGSNLQFEVAEIRLTRNVLERDAASPFRHKLTELWRDQCAGQRQRSDPPQGLRHEVRRQKLGIYAWTGHSRPFQYLSCLGESFGKRFSGHWCLVVLAECLKPRLLVRLDG
jgi:hypothetical protein